MDPANVSAKFEVRSFTHPEIIEIEFWVRLRTPNLGQDEAVGGREWYRSKERW